MTSTIPSAPNQVQPHPAVQAAIDAARAAAPIDAVREAWARQMEVELARLDPTELHAVATMAARPSPGMVFLDPAEMVRMAIASQRAHAAAAPLEFAGLASSTIDPMNRHELLTEEFDRFWSNPPTSVRALPRPQRAFLQDLHRAAIMEQPVKHELRISECFVQPPMNYERFSGLKLHVSARGPAETMEILARMLPVLPADAAYKIARHSLLRFNATTHGVPATETQPGRKVTEQQRKAITVYLPPDLSAEQLDALLRAMTVERSTDIIANELEITPGVFMRCEHRVRVREGVLEAGYFSLYREAANAPRAADLEAHAVLGARPDLAPGFVAVIGALPKRTDPRVAVMIEALGLGPDFLRDRNVRAQVEHVCRAGKLSPGTGFDGEFWESSASPQELATAFTLLAELQCIRHGLTSDSVEPAIAQALAWCPELAYLSGLERFAASRAAVQPAPPAVAAPTPQATPTPSAAPAPVSGPTAQTRPTSLLPLPRNAQYGQAMNDLATRATALAEFHHRLAATRKYLAATRTPPTVDRTAIAADLPNLTSNLRAALVVAEWERFLDPASTTLMDAVARQLAEAWVLAHNLGAPERLVLAVDAAVAAGHHGDHVTVVATLSHLGPQEWQSIAPDDRVTGLFHYARSLAAVGNREAARHVTEWSITEQSAWGPAGYLSRSYAEVQRFGLLDAPTRSDVERVQWALNTMQATMLEYGTIAPASTAALARDWSHANAVVQHQPTLTAPVRS